MAQNWPKIKIKFKITSKQQKIAQYRLKFVQNKAVIGPHKSCIGIGIGITYTQKKNGTEIVPLGVQYKIPI